jgi:hypothetical protein
MQKLVKKLNRTRLVASKKLDKAKVDKVMTQVSTHLQQKESECMHAMSSLSTLNQH